VNTSTSQTVTTYDIGVSYRDNGARVFYGGGTTSGTGTIDGSGFSPGDTLFLVVKYDPGQSIPGSDSKDDVASLYVFPNAGTASLTEPGTATSVSSNGGATADYFYGSGTTLLDTGLRTAFLRNNTSEPATTQVDELRVGTSYADVVPEPASISLLGLAGFGALARRRRT